MSVWRVEKGGMLESAVAEELVYGVEVGYMAVGGHIMPGGHQVFVECQLANV